MGVPLIISFQKIGGNPQSPNFSAPAARGQGAAESDSFCSVPFLSVPFQTPRITLDVQNEIWNGTQLKRNETERIGMELKWKGTESNGREMNETEQKESYPTVDELGTGQNGTERNGMKRNKLKAELLQFGMKRNGTKRNGIKKNESKSQFDWNETERDET